MVLIIYPGNYSRGGNSSVDKISKRHNRIDIYFRDNRGNRAKYRYEKAIIGKKHYNNIKQLAYDGKGLNSYIIKNALRCKKM